VSESEGKSFNPLVFAIVTALEDHRVEDALMLVNTLVDEKGTRDAVLDVAYVAILLHKSSPAMPVRLLGVISEQELDGDSILGADIGQEFLQVLAQLLSTGPAFDEESLAILNRYELRPGSPEPIKMIARCMNAVVSDLRLQLMLPSPGVRSRDEVDPIVERAMQKMWDELERNRPESG